jgi:undecaprenyl-diphosphatase
MSPWEAMLLGAVQGFTEFFPVSSSGHLVLTQAFLGLSLPGVSFEVMLHVATLVSVLIMYRGRILALLRGAAQGSTWIYVGKLVLATVPAVMVGFGLEDWFEARFDDPRFTGTMLLVTGAVVWSSRWALTAARFRLLELLPIVIAAVVSVLARTAVPFLGVIAIEALIMGVSRISARADAETDPGWGTALSMGIAQAAAILPGVSRSGNTVVNGLWRRLDPVAAAEFSFLMSIPAIVGAAVLKVPDLLAEGSASPGVMPLALGSLTACICGILAIRFFVAMLRKRAFWGFGVYCWIAGAAFLLT